MGTAHALEKPPINFRLSRKHLSIDSIDIFTRLVANQSSDQLNLGTITASSP
jgi:hypothetical protein